MVSASELLQELPPFENRELVIADQQAVHDIINEVLSAHEYFAVDYSIVKNYFRRPSVFATCETLFDFCKRYIRYDIETEENQTTRSPAATLAIASGDCKHYAGFIAGVLDALKRDGEKIDWYYRFASYDIFNNVPGHVFVVVKQKGREIWIDPVLEYFDQRLQPAFIVDKKTSVMLKRLSGLGALTDEPRTPYEIYDMVPSVLVENANNASLYSAIELLLKYKIINADGTANLDDLDALEFRISADEHANLLSAFGTVNEAAVNGLFTSIAHGIQVVLGVVPRNAYLGLVSLNVFGLASKLFRCIYGADNTGTTYYQPGQDKIYRAWYALGGDWSKLLAAVKSGQKKKAILGIAPAVLAATAATIIAALGKAISEILKAQKDATGIDYNIDPATGLPYGQVGSGNTGGGGGGDIMDFIKNNAMIIAVAGAGLYLLMKKK